MVWVIIGHGVTNYFSRLCIICFCRLFFLFIARLNLNSTSTSTSVGLGFLFLFTLVNSCVCSYKLKVDLCLLLQTKDCLFLKTIYWFMFALANSFVYIFPCSCKQGLNEYFNEEINYFYFPQKSGCQGSQSYLCCPRYPTIIVFVFLATKSNYCQVPL